MSSYRHVFEPIVLGGCTIPNRICRSAHGTGLQGQDLIAYHEARARGGVGLTFLEAASVHASAPFPMDVSHDGCIDFYKQLSARIEPHGMKVMQQLYYPGAAGGYWSASPVPNPLVGVVPHAMSQADIREIVDSFVAAAIRCEKGGLAGVEIHASSGYLIHEFLSPALNRREDDYGGSEENRLRLLREILEAVRGAVTSGFVVGVRLPNDDHVPGGLGPAENARIAGVIEPLVDYVSLHMGAYWRFHKLIAPSDDPLGVEMPSNNIVAANISKPVIVVGRIMTLDHAEALIRSGEADMVSMVRALIADPELVNKARRGEEHRIRPCIGTNQGCVGKLMTEGRMGCVVNIAASHEQVVSFEPNPIGADAERKKVLVIGGGPAGMEAARTAAMRGHEVVLAEALPRLGGQLALAASAPHRADLGALDSWLQSELELLGVEILVNTMADEGWVAEQRADQVIVATGAMPRWDGFQVLQPATPVPGHDLPHVVDSWRLFGVGAPPVVKGPAVIFDDTGTFEAISVADKLLAEGIHVTMVSRYEVLGEKMPYPAVTVGAARERLFGRNFDFIGGHYLREIGSESVEIGVLFTERRRELKAATVVLVGFNHPNRELAEGLKERGIPAALVGDVNGTRDLHSAIHSAVNAARSV